MDVNKTVTDAGYIAIGLGVMGVQQAQARTKQLQDRLGEVAQCTAGKVRNLQGSVESSGRTIETKTREARENADQQIKATVAKLQEFRTEVTNRVEPIVEQVQALVADLP